MDSLSQSTCRSDAAGNNLILLHSIQWFYSQEPFGGLIFEKRAIIRQYILNSLAQDDISILSDVDLWEAASKLVLEVEWCDDDYLILWIEENSV